jgi:hypothetical protein
MKLEYSGKTSCYAHKHNPSAPCDGGPAISNVTLIEAQWSNMPIEVYEEVQHLWRYLEYGNDVYYYEFTLNDFEEMIGEDDGIQIETWHWGPTREEQIGWVKGNSKLPYLTQWLNEQGFEKDQHLLLHYWW